MKNDFIVLAAGKGLRMLNKEPKVLQHLGGVPMAQHLLNTLSEIENSRPIIVLGDQADKVRSSLRAPRNSKWVKQRKQIGTGNAVKTALSFLRRGSIAIVLYGDVPLVKTITLKNLIKIASSGSLAVLTFTKENPKGYGRIIRDSKNQIEEIIEEKEATSKHKKVKEVNSGIIAIKSEQLKKLIPLIKNHNSADEYYLTDIVLIAKRNKVKVSPVLLDSPEEALGANTAEELHDLERVFQRCLALDMVRSGVKIADVNRIDIRGTLKAGRGTFIDVNNVFEGEVSLGSGVNVGPNCFIKNSEIGNKVTLKANTVVEDSDVGPSCSLGPFARIRGGTKLEDSSELGNFVEVNRSRIGKLSKAKHLTYLGDATLGRGVNIGAGTITCNYDGSKKHKTNLSDEVFIGSNTSLIAPVSVGKGSYTGAGSVITKNVPENSLAIGRAKQSPPIKKRDKN